MSEKSLKVMRDRNGAIVITAENEKILVFLKENLSEDQKFIVVRDILAVEGVGSAQIIYD